MPSRCSSSCAPSAFGFILFELGRQAERPHAPHAAGRSCYRPGRQRGQLRRNPRPGADRLALKALMRVADAWSCALVPDPGADRLALGGLSGVRRGSLRRVRAVAG